MKVKLILATLLTLVTVQTCTKAVFNVQDPVVVAPVEVEAPEVNHYQDRIDKPLKYVVYHHAAGAFEIVDDPTEDKAIGLWDICQAEDVTTPGDIKVWQSNIGQCLETPEWRATNVNKVVDEYRATR